MLNPISQRKGWGRKSEKKEKEEMKKKGKKKNRERRLLGVLVRCMVDSNNSLV